jgi:hypothetical protein
MGGNSLQMILEEIQLLLEPVVAALESELSRQTLFGEIGWHLEAIPGFPLEELTARLTEFRDGYDNLLNLVEDPPDSFAAFAGALETIDGLYNALRGLHSLAEGTNLESLPFERLGRDLIEHLTLEYLEDRHPLSYHLATLLTLIDPPGREPGAEADPTNVFPGLTRPRPRLRLDRLEALLGDPVAALNSEYLPFEPLETAEQARQVADKLFPRIGLVLECLGWNYLYGIKPDYELDFGETGNALGAGMLTVFRETDEEDTFGFTLSLCPEERGGLGLVVVPYGAAVVTLELENWLLKLELEGALEGFAFGGRGVTLPEGVEDAAVGVRLTLIRVSGDEETALLLGSPTGNRLEVKHFAVSGSALFKETEGDFGFLLNFEDASLVLGPGDGDSFLKSILPEDGMRLDFDLGFGWSNRRGFHIEGGAGLEARLPVRRRIGSVLSVDLVHLALQADGESIRGQAGITFSVRLGPIAATVDGVGLEANLTFPPEGNLGVADLAMDFKPPTGIALAIDSDLVSGAGFLLFEPDKHRYAGALVLEIGEVTVNAAGLLTTRLPDGRQGYSLLIAISAAGFTPIQLGLGFTLNGVGGLLGVNRTVQVEVLRSGLKNDSLDAVLFPDNPLARLPQLVHALEQVFPSADGRYLFGPAAIIGWGTPTLLTLELALVLEVPAPVRLVVLGRLQALLPRKEAPVVRLNMDALGVVDFTRGEAALDAILYDSRLMDYALSGEMAIRLRWESEPGFVLAVGGLNPRFNAPAALQLPKLARIAIDFTRRDNPRLRLSAYLALTSNTLQLGALVELYVAVSKLSLQGALGFDVLVNFSPFGFVADLSGAVAVKWGDRTLLGVFLEASLVGPDPLVVNGKATVKVWIFSKSVNFDHTLGDADLPPPLPAADPLPDLMAALREPRNWSAQLPTGKHTLVTLREIPAEAGVVQAHPLGRLTVTQNVVPLNLSIDRYGGAAPAGARRFRIDAVTLGTDPNPPRQTVRDWFAPAQFLDLSDTERLSRPSFEKLEAGLRIGGDEVAFGGAGAETLMAVAPIAYETVLIDRQGKAAKGGSYAPDPARLSAATALGAVARRGLAHAGKARYYGPGGGVEVAEAGI